MASMRILQLLLISSLMVNMIISDKTDRIRINSLQGKSLVDELNSDKSTGWKADYNTRFHNSNIDEIKQLLGVAEDYNEVFEERLAKDQAKGEKPENLKLKINGYSEYNNYYYNTKNYLKNQKPVELPENFDSREAWPKCAEIIDRIEDQSLCGSCWAVSSAAAFSDRVCIASKGEIKQALAADDLLSCCTGCGYGCTGGYPYRAFDYITRYGIVTGGHYADNSTCLPYPFPPCTGSKRSNYKECRTGHFKPPACTKTCQSEYGTNWVQDKKYAKASSVIALVKNPVAMQQEILLNGPMVLSAMEIYEDFMYYKGGVYKHVKGGYLGLHAIRVIGWGVDNGTPYWLVANSWGPQWGENGYFRIYRGTNECNVEGYTNAAQVDLTRAN